MLRTKIPLSYNTMPITTFYHTQTWSTTMHELHDLLNKDRRDQLKLEEHDALKKKLQPLKDGSEEESDHADVLNATMASEVANEPYEALQLEVLKSLVHLSLSAPAVAALLIFETIESDITTSVTIMGRKFSLPYSDDIQDRIIATVLKNPNLTHQSDLDQFSILLNTQITKISETLKTISSQRDQLLEQPDTKYGTPFKIRQKTEYSNSLSMLEIIKLARSLLDKTKNSSGLSSYAEALTMLVPINTAAEMAPLTADADTHDTSLDEINVDESFTEQSVCALTGHIRSDGAKDLLISHVYTNASESPSTKASVTPSTVYTLNNLEDPIFLTLMCGYVLNALDQFALRSMSYQMSLDMTPAARGYNNFHNKCLKHLLSLPWQAKTGSDTLYYYKQYIENDAAQYTGNNPKNLAKCIGAFYIHFPELREKAQGVGTTVWKAMWNQNTDVPFTSNTHDMFRAYADYNDQPADNDLAQTSKRKFTHTISKELRTIAISPKSNLTFDMSIRTIFETTLLPYITSMHGNFMMEKDRLAKRIKENTIALTSASATNALTHQNTKDVLALQQKTQQLSADLQKLKDEHAAELRIKRDENADLRKQLATARSEVEALEDGELQHNLEMRQGTERVATLTAENESLKAQASAAKAADLKLSTVEELLGDTLAMEYVDQSGNPTEVFELLKEECNADLKAKLITADVFEADAFDDDQSDTHSQRSSLSK